MSAVRRSISILAACALTVCAVLLCLPQAEAEEGNYYISSAQEWNEYATRIAAGENFFGKTLSLTRDISGQIMPLGDKETPFCGTLDGGGHIIYADITGKDHTAPVGYLADGVVRRLGVQGDIRGEQAVGGVIGFNDRGRAEECYHVGSVTADNYAGGVVGENRGVILNCYHLGAVRAQGEGRFAGGICATNDYDGRVENCYAVAEVDCTGRGGITGYAGRGSVLGCAYHREKCDRGYSQAGNAVLNIEALDTGELTRKKLSSAYSVFEGGGANWGAYPRLNALISPKNAYLDWDDHLMTHDLLVLEDMGEVSIQPLLSALLPQPEKAGYTFEGWFTAPEGGSLVERAAAGADMRLYARRELITYTITFDLGGGTFAADIAPALTYTVLDEVVLPGKDDVLLDGMTLQGWADKNGNVLDVIPAGSVGDITLTARYAPASAALREAAGKWFWVILDVALALALCAEALLLARLGKSRKKEAAFAFFPFSSATLFYPAGLYIACAELAAMLILPLVLLRGKRRAFSEAAAAEEERGLCLEAPFIPPLLPAGEPLAEIEEIDARLRCRNSFTARLAMSAERTKGHYRAFKEYALSYEKARSRISWTGENFYAGKKPLARLNVAGNTLKIYFALEPEGVEKRFFAKDMSGVKKYALTPVMVKVRSDRALRRAQRLFDAAAERLALRRGIAADAVLDNEELLKGGFDRRELIDKGLIKSDVIFKDKSA